MLITSLLIRHSLARLHRARSDNSPAFPFYGPASLGLKEQPFSFRSGPWLLRGSFYWKGDAFPEKPLVVFFHGLGSGRIAYLRLIAAYAEEGYAIASFDYTGCGESEGPCIYGLGHVLKDVRSFFGWLRSQNKYGPFPFVYSVGHSWGGFASLLSTGEPEVKKAVSFGRRSFSLPRATEIICRASVQVGKESGKRQGRDPCPLFDFIYHRRMNAHFFSDLCLRHARFFTVTSIYVLCHAFSPSFCCFRL